MRIAFFGSPPFGSESFQALLSRQTKPLALVTAPQRRAGRGRRREMPNPLVEAAQGAGLAVLRPADARSPEFLAELRGLEPDLGVVVSFGQILSQELLEIPRHGFINVHASLLPRWRGASPVQAAILAGDTVTGVTVQKVVRKLDAGAVLARREVAVGPRETAPQLAARLGRAGAALLVEFLDGLGEGPLPDGEAQDDDEVTLCRKLRREEARIDWSATAEEVDRRVRAMAGWPVAETSLPNGETVKVLCGEPGSSSLGGDSPPGRIVQLGPELEVACGSGCYRILELQRAGKASLDAAAFLRGVVLRVGERLT